MLIKASLKIFFLCFVVCNFVCCSNPPYKGKDLYGVDEFVLDSYKIRRGKFSILELEGKPKEKISPSLLEEYTDTIQNGDVLNIVIYHPEREDLVLAVDSVGQKVGFEVVNGRINLPDLTPIKVENLTINQAQEKLQKTYNSQIQGVEVFLSFKNRLDKRVELAGQVKTPSIEVDGKLRLFDVLARAQIPTSANLFKSYVVRGVKLLPVDMNKLIREGDMSQNLVMKGGDKIYIAEDSASTIMMMGEVGKRGLINLPEGYMPLREALAKAGGIPFTGNRAFIQVIRGNITRPKIYTLNWKHIIELPTDAMLLMPGDIVYVAATPITEWNRFISQLFPSFTAVDLFCKGMTGIISIK